MESHPCPEGGSELTAALHASGALTPAERAAFEAHLATGCSACKKELERLAPVVGALASAVPSAEPSPAVREALIERMKGFDSATDTPLRRNLAPSPALPQGLFTLRSKDTEWEPSDVPGVSLRVLYVDKPSNQFTALVKMLAGATYPRHVHSGPEQCLVLEGDLRVGTDVLHAGDYQRAEPGSLHGVQSTEHGCLLLITSSLSDSFS